MKRKNCIKVCTLVLMIILISITNSCKKNKDNAIAIGKTYEGGIIFYIDVTGNHGLVVAAQDLWVAATDAGSFSWGCSGTLITGASGISVGTGKQNTADILANCTEKWTAAYYCSTLVLNGYNDWYIPSKEELLLIYTNLHKKGIGNFTTQDGLGNIYAYWSSSQIDSQNAWTLPFYYGYCSSGCKICLNKLRPVRSF